MKRLEDAGIDPATSRMLSERSTIWANPPRSILEICHIENYADEYSSTYWIQNQCSINRWYNTIRD